jgi:cardiolipin synthase A/B
VDLYFFYSLGPWFAIFSALALLVCVWAIIDLLQKRKEPMAMLSWILGIILFPMMGVSFYFLIGERRVRRRARRKRKRVREIASAIASASLKEKREENDVRLPALAAHPEVESSLEQLAAISTRLGNFPFTRGNKVLAFTSATEVYKDLLQSIDAAEHHIHFEYYIFRADETGRLFRDRLTARAREGIEVRLLLDGVGSFGTRLGFLRPLKEAGGKVDIFLPAIPLRRQWHLNCRNHRKIVVVDGKIAYTGSQNIGDEHRSLLRSRRRPWKETHLRVEGPAAQQLQDIFIEDWFFASKEDLTKPAYLKRQPADGESLVQVISSGPDQEESILSHIFFSALSQARESIRISTPYFVPDPVLITALQNAAYRGLTVEVMIPSITDNRVVLWAGRSFYQELLRAGVRIYEYDLGMLHAKTILIDDRWSMVGSANMDIRSFLLNFEVTASVFDRKIARFLVEDFQAKKKECRQIPLLAGARGALFSTLVEGAARLFSPLL